MIVEQYEFDYTKVKRVIYKSAVTDYAMPVIHLEESLSNFPPPVSEYFVLPQDSYAELFSVDKALFEVVDGISRRPKEKYKPELISLEGNYRLQILRPYDITELVLDMEDGSDDVINEEDGTVEEYTTNPLMIAKFGQEDSAFELKVDCVVTFVTKVNERDINLDIHTQRQNPLPHIDETVRIAGMCTPKDMLHKSTVDTLAGLNTVEKYGMFLVHSDGQIYTLGSLIDKEFIDDNKE